MMVWSDETRRKLKEVSDSLQSAQLDIFVFAGNIPNFDNVNLQDLCVNAYETLLNARQQIASIPGCVQDEWLREASYLIKNTLEYFRFYESDLRTRNPLSDERERLLRHSLKSYIEKHRWALHESSKKLNSLWIDSEHNIPTEKSFNDAPPQPVGQTFASSVDSASRATMTRKELTALTKDAIGHSANSTPTNRISRAIKKGDLNEIEKGVFWADEGKEWVEKQDPTRWYDKS